MRKDAAIRPKTPEDGSKSLKTPQHAPQTPCDACMHQCKKISKASSVIFYSTSGSELTFENCYLLLLLLLLLTRRLAWTFFVHNHLNLLAQLCRDRRRHVLSAGGRRSPFICDMTFYIHL